MSTTSYVLFGHGGSVTSNLSKVLLRLKRRVALFTLVSHQVLLFAFIVQGLVAVKGQETIGPRGEPLRPILEILDQAKQSGSLEFSGPCAAGHVPDFPQLRAVAGGDPLRNLQETFVDHLGIRVSRDSNGTVRMIETGIPTDVLNIRIRHLSFGEAGEKGGHATYNPNYALAVILRAPEVIAFMRAHYIDWPFHGGGVPGNLVGRWPTDQPRISGSLENVTVSEALDHVLEAFPGLWIYENCEASAGGNRNIFFGFFYLQKIGTRVLVVE